MDKNRWIDKDGCKNYYHGYTPVLMSQLSSHGWHWSAPHQHPILLGHQVRCTLHLGYYAGKPHLRHGCLSGSARTTCHPAQQGIKAFSSIQFKAWGQERPSSSTAPVIHQSAESMSPCCDGTRSQRWLQPGHRGHPPEGKWFSRAQGSVSECLCEKSEKLMRTSAPVKSSFQQDCFTKHRVLTYSSGTQVRQTVCNQKLIST